MQQLILNMTNTSDGTFERDFSYPLIFKLYAWNFRLGFELFIYGGDTQILFPMVLQINSVY